jgi:hypothetical protein
MKPPIELPPDPVLREFLERISADPPLEIEWIDLLSQLEYVGCRKIVKSIGFEAVSLDVLRHVSEEASHAYLLKTVAEEGGLRGRSWRDGRFSEAGWGYFQELDHRISALPGAEGLRYPGVSWAVERRVLAVYPAYLEVTRNEALRRVLRRILAQEKEHGERFGQVAFPDGFSQAAARIEESLWPEFIAEAGRRAAPARA